jgi:hypothetical protein
MQTYHEQRDTLYGDVDEEEAHGAEVVGDVHHRPLDVVHLSLFVLVGSTPQHKSLRSNHALALIQKPAFFRVARHQKGGTKTNQDGEEALEEENVSPGVNDHARSAPRRDTSKSFPMRQFSIRHFVVACNTYPVASRPPKAPAMEAAET